MSKNTVILIGFEDQPNLGLGYLVSTLIENGFCVEVLNFRMGRQSILKRIIETRPLIVGLSIIYQYYTPRFSKLVNFLRNEGIKCLVCVGGHYPSLRYQEVLEAIPGLDCVVRFEGEYTLLELAKCLEAGHEWRDIQSIAYQSDGEYVATPLRSLIEDLDALPFPHRRIPPNHCLGMGFTSIIASRGCPRNCSFCSIRRFYSIPPGRLRRTRSPQNVVNEIYQLYNDYAVRMFLFHDDDFSLMSKRDREWVDDFIECLKQHGLQNSIMWKISCRADEVKHQIFTKLKSAGLFLVYLGLESGNETGLRTLNKHVTVQQNREAVDILKKLGLRYEFGFMLFDPSSTIDLVLENIRFLREICDDGSALVSFCKTLPYAGTEIEKQLQQEGRLQGDKHYPDYRFLDERVDAWFTYLGEIFYSWVAGSHCIQTQLRWSQVEIDILDRFYSHVAELTEHKKRIKFLTTRYNEIFFRIVEDSADLFISLSTVNENALLSIRSAATTQKVWLEERLNYQRRTFLTKIKPQSFFDQSTN